MCDIIAPPHNEKSRSLRDVGDAPLTDQPTAVAEGSADGASGMQNNSTTSMGGPWARSCGITKYTRLQLGHTTTLSRVGPAGEPERPCSATGAAHAQCHVAQFPKTLAREAARFMN